jgi:hypothetical protein
VSQWLGPVGAWLYVIGFLAIGQFLFTVGIHIVTNAKKVDDWLGYAVGVLGLASFIIAGIWIEQTFVFRLFGWARQFEVLVILGFGFVFWQVLKTPFAAIPDKYVPKATVTLSLAIAWLVIPSMLRQGYVPGVAGQVSSEGVRTFSTTVMPYVRWFG